MVVSSDMSSWNSVATSPCAAVSRPAAASSAEKYHPSSYMTCVCSHSGT